MVEAKDPNALFRGALEAGANRHERFAELARIESEERERRHLAGEPEPEVPHEIRKINVGGGRIGSIIDGGLAVLGGGAISAFLGGIEISTATVDMSIGEKLPIMLLFVPVLLVGLWTTGLGVRTILHGIVGERRKKR